MRKHLGIGRLKRISVFLCFSLVNQRHTSCITVYNRTVTNIKNTVRAVHSCNSWFFARSSPSSGNDIASEAKNDMKMVYNGPMPILLAPLEPLADSYHEKNSFWPQAIMGIVRKSPTSPFGLLPRTYCGLQDIYTTKGHHNNPMSLGMSTNVIFSNGFSHLERSYLYISVICLRKDKTCRPL